PSPIFMDRPQDVAARASVCERLGEHLHGSVKARHLETSFYQANRVKPGSGCDIQNLARTAAAQLTDKELAFAFLTGLPVDELVPFVHKALDVLRAIVVSFTHGCWFFSKRLGRFVVGICIHIYSILICGMCPIESPTEVAQRSSPVLTGWIWQRIRKYKGGPAMQVPESYCEGSTLLRARTTGHIATHGRRPRIQK